jgi:hypothetical protein
MDEKKIENKIETYDSSSDEEDSIEGDLKKDNEFIKKLEDNILIEKKEDKIEWKLIVMINTIKYWIMYYFYDFDCISIITLIKFLQNIKNEKLRSISINLISKIELSLLNITNFNFINTLTSQPEPILPKVIKEEFNILGILNNKKRLESYRSSKTDHNYRI